MRYAFEAFIDASHVLARHDDAAEYAIDVRSQRFELVGDDMRLTLAPNGKGFAVAQSWDVVEVWSWNPLRKVREIARAHEPLFSPDGDRVVVLRGEMPNESAVAVTTANGVEVTFPMLPPDTTEVAGSLARVLRGERSVRATSDGGRYVFWSADGKRPLLDVTDGVHAVSADGRWIVAKGDPEERVVRVGGAPRSVPDPECRQWIGHGAFPPEGATFYIPIEMGYGCALDLASWVIHKFGALGSCIPVGYDDDHCIPAFQALPANALLATNLAPYSGIVMDARTGEPLLKGASGPVGWGTSAVALDDRSALIAARSVSDKWQVWRIDLAARRIIWTHDADDGTGMPPDLRLAPDARTAAALEVDRFEVFEVDDGTCIFDSAQTPPPPPP